MLAEMREDALFDQVRDPALQAWIATSASTTLHAGRDARRCVVRSKSVIRPFKHGSPPAPAPHFMLAEMREYVLFDQSP